MKMDGQPNMRTLHVISHTHWDREWYQTFQQFRLRLVHLVDGLLDLLEKDPNFKYFMLDGQTLVLEDYLTMRPEQEAILREHIQTGRIIIGPWHILPDMFLVGPEAHIRNLLQGDRTARKFGPKMSVGYIPDPFGHPGQIPQILRGFGIETACLWRGVADGQPVEFWWQSPDGSRVFMAYLRDSYSNGAGLQMENLPLFAESVARVGASLAAHSAASDDLIMLGTDHMEPSPNTSAAIAYADQALAETRVIHSTLPQYIAAVRSSLNGKDLPVVEGELRDCRRIHLLPGVLSTRMWIKQRNHASETLLTKWAEPFTTFQELASEKHQSSLINTQVRAEPKAPCGLCQKSKIIHHAWRLLMENHPHDSICGCSIDQVHDEMKTRFDQVDQIAEELTKQSLDAIAGAVSTDDQPSALKAIIVFNPSSFSRNESVSAEFNLPPEVSAFEIVDELGNTLPHETTSAGARELVNLALDPKGLRDGFQAIHDGMVANLGVRSYNMRREGSLIHLNIVVAKGTPDKAVWERGLREFFTLLDDPTITGYHVRASLGDTVQVVFPATAPGLGWRTYYIYAKESTARPATLHPLTRALLPVVSRFIADTSIGRSLLSRLQRDASSQPPYRIENEFFIVEAEPHGTLCVTDKRNGTVYQGLNRFVDGGDCGDEYNYSPPDSDSPRPVPRLIGISMQRGPVLQTLTLTLTINLPPRLNRNRKSRVSQAKYFVAMPIICCVRLTAGVARVDVHTTLENNAHDHRLRVHFPVPFEVDSAEHDGHFEIVRRKTGVPVFDRETWIEDPRPEVPQRAFTDVSNGQVGLMLANRGLPEVEVLNIPSGSEIALTLLRCVGWLSRDDFQTRRGQAGPEEETPSAQMIGKWAFDYSMIPHGADRPYELAYGFETPLRAVSAAIHAGSLPAQGSFVTVVDGNGFIVSAVKKAESGAGWIARGYNLTGEDIQVRLRPWKRFNQAARVNLAEQKIADLRPEKGTRELSFPVKAHEIVTIWFDE